MRTLLIYLSLFFLSIASIHAQSMKKMAQKTEFESRLAKEAQTVESIESDFTQVKISMYSMRRLLPKGSSTTRRPIKSAWNISARWIISS